jgi:hypothetical protein
MTSVLHEISFIRRKIFHTRSHGKLSPSSGELCHDKDSSQTHASRASQLPEADLH